jgi:hypothetical protein
MTHGIVIFAQNNASIDYVKLATFAAKRAQHFLDLPVSLITDARGWLEKSQPDHPFDQVIDVEFSNTVQKRTFFDGALFSKHLEWKNFARNRAYDLSPYDKTLVIDSDYIINSDNLKIAFERDAELQIYSSSTDLAAWRPLQEFTRINPYSIPFYWATAFVFEKNIATETFFNLVSYIKINWNYFRILYNIDTSLYRNDYAFSIAIHLMNNKSVGDFAMELPGSMIFTKDKDILVSIKESSMQFLVEKEKYTGEYLLAKTQALDIHVMNKLSLSRFIDGGSGV